MGWAITDWFWSNPIMKVSKLVLHVLAYLIWCPHTYWLEDHHFQPPDFFTLYNIYYILDAYFAQINSLWRASAEADGDGDDESIACFFLRVMDLTLVAISSLYAEQSFAAKFTPCHGQYYLLFEANEAQFSSIRSYYYLTTTSAWWLNCTINCSPRSMLAWRRVKGTTYLHMYVLCTTQHIYIITLQQAKL